MAPQDADCYPGPVNVRPWHSFQAQLHLLRYIAGSPKDGQLKHSLPNVNVSPLPYKTGCVQRPDVHLYLQEGSIADGRRPKQCNELLHGD